MKFAFLTYLFRRFPLEYCFKMAKQYGFHGIEVWGARPHAYAYDIDAKKTADIIGFKKAYGIETPMFTPEILGYPYSLCSRDEKERVETTAYLIESARVAEAIGADMLQITLPHPGYGVDRKQVWKNAVDGLKEICRVAESLGVSVVIEPLSPSEGNLITDIHDLVQMLEDIDSPAAKGMLDIVPPVIANEPLSEYFDMLKERLVYIHICNSDAKTEFHMQLDDPSGEIPIEDMFRIFKRCGYDGWCSLELLAPYFKDPELYLSQGKRCIDRVCQSLNIKAG